MVGMVATYAIFLVPVVLGQSWLHCDVIPWPGCDCTDPESPAVVCSHLNMTFLPLTALESHMATVTSLDLSHNSIMVLVDRAFQNTSLRALKLSHNRISVIQEYAFLGLDSTLEWLDLSHNSISHLPGLNPLFNNIRVLHLEYNQLVNFWLNDKKSRMEELYIHRNPVEMLRTGPARALHTLYFSLMEGSTLNIYDHTAKNIRHLGLISTSQNEKQQVFTPPILDKFPKVTHLYLEGILFRTKRIFPIRHSGLTYLESFVIRDGFVSYIPTEVKRMTNLQVLDLKNNKIKTGKFNRLKKLQALKEIHLTRNSIRSLGSHTIAPRSHLEVVDLRHNVLQTLSPYSFDFESRKDLRVFLGSNPLACKEAMCWLYFMMYKELQGQSHHMSHHEISHNITCINSKLEKGLFYDTMKPIC